MRHFKAGTFEKHRVPKHFQRFSPVEALHSLEEVDLEELYESGKRLILLDVDNTLLPWRSEDVPDSTFAWVAKARALGFELCILSNTRNPERLGRLSEKLAIDFIRDKFKPNPIMYLMALKKYEVKAEEAIMIGDQLMTDIWGANRAGVDAIWVKPMGTREFVGTKYLSRNVERVIGKILHNYFQTETLDQPVGPGFFKHDIVRQFIKFGMVGAVATVVDLGLNKYLIAFAPGWNGNSLQESVADMVFKVPGASELFKDSFHAAFPPIKVVTVVIATVVSFLLNRWYTFEVAHEKATAKQAAKFFIVALSAMVINTTVGTFSLNFVSGSESLQWWVASLTGMVAGVFFNFAGQRIWTFRNDEPSV